MARSPSSPSRSGAKSDPRAPRRKLIVTTTRSPRVGEAAAVEERGRAGAGDDPAAVEEHDDRSPGVVDGGRPHVEREAVLRPS